MLPMPGNFLFLFIAYFFSHCKLLYDFLWIKIPISLLLLSSKKKIFLKPLFFWYRNFLFLHYFFFFQHYWKWHNSEPVLLSFTQYNHKCIKQLFDWKEKSEKKKKRNEKFVSFISQVPKREVRVWHKNQDKSSGPWK